MDANQMTKQIINFQKTTFNHYVDALVLIQAQNAKMIQTLLEQVSWLPDESNRFMDQWLAMSSKGKDDMKSVLDDTFETIKNLCVSQ